MAFFTNDKSNTIISGSNDNDTFLNGGVWDDPGGGSTRHTAGSNVTINAGAGDDSN